MKQNNATFSAKALAYKTLERNTSETFAAKLWINNATFTPKKSSQKLRPEKPYFGLEIEQLKTHAANDWDEVKGNPLKAWNKDVLCMFNQLRIDQSCKLHFLRGATRNSRLILRENMKQNNATFSAKALAYKTLERNTSETFAAKLWINNATFTPKKSPQKLRSEKPYFGLEIDQLKTLAADDWDEVKGNPAMLKALIETYLMIKGLDPELSSTIYIKTVHCQNCGEVKTWVSCPYNTVLCCQWCLVNNDLSW